MTPDGRTVRPSRVMPPRRLVIGMTGASGSVYCQRLVEVLAEYSDTEVHLVLSDAAKITMAYELGVGPIELTSKVAHIHDVQNIAASIASGSFRVDGMVVVPCSMHSMSAIAYCQSDNLLTRAADVCLKERRPLILVPRETPLHLGHLRAMVAAAELGAVILPPFPAFYTRPKTISDIVDHTVGKILDQLGWEHDLYRRWGEPETVRDGKPTADPALRPGPRAGTRDAAP